MGSTPVGLSASRGAAILGLSKWSTPFEVWQKIMETRQLGFNESRGYKYPEYEESSVMRWGLAFEDAVIRLSEEAHGLDIVHREKLYTAFNHDFITCHIDGWYGGSVSSPLHEGKTTSQFIYRQKWGEPGTDRVPRDYAIQVQHQMLCTGADDTIVSVLVFPKMVDDWEKEGWEIYKPEPEICYSLYRDDDLYDPNRWATVLNQMGYFHQYPVKRNQKLIDLMIEKYTNFWNCNVIPGIPPKPQTYDDIKRMTPEPVGTIIATPQLERWAVEYKEIGKEIGDTGPLKKRRDQLKVLILDWMRQQDSVMDDDSRERTLLMDTRGHKLISFNGKVFR